ncbi:MAG: helix-turn-helix domain-containing protein, partial [Desulfovibrio sp.]|nr:helix-turn-helix domain-containing protein [Desulfovibrio sp.]
QECYVRGITKGRRNPTVTTMYAICEALGVPTSRFFDMVDEERKRLSAERNEP